MFMCGCNCCWVDVSVRTDSALLRSKEKKKAHEEAVLYVSRHGMGSLYNSHKAIVGMIKTHVE